MKKTIIFVVINMNLGGTEKALLNMIYELPKERFDMTILLLERKGRLLEVIPDHVHVVEMKHYQTIKHLIQKPPLETVVQLTKTGRLVKASQLASIHLLTKLTQDRRLFYKFILKHVPDEFPAYDVAVAYAGPMDLISYLIIHKIKAHKKVQWIHFDIDNIGFDARLANKLYSQFQQIYIVSEEGRDKFLQQVPSLTSKTAVFPNLLSAELIKQQAVDGSGFTDSFDGIRLLTVGRLSHEKGQDIALWALHQLMQKGFNVKWYFVGCGSAKAQYEQMAKSLGIEDRAVFLGEQLNPYQYMKQCDIYVQPSRHEGYCITLAEAKLFHKPIIATNFTGAAEQITDGQTGLIVRVDPYNIYEAVTRLIQESTLRRAFSHNLAQGCAMASTEPFYRAFNDFESL